jgi:MFS family permease
MRFYEGVGLPVQVPLAHASAGAAGHCQQKADMDHFSDTPRDPATNPEVKATTTAPGWGALFAGVGALRSLTLAGGVALHAINVYLATTILPSVVAEIGGIALYAWNTTLFVVASILGSALAARLLAAVGPRAAYAGAAGLFAAGTLISALAPSMPAMLAGRSVQGLGGGFLFALSYAMIRMIFAEPLWPRAMALVSGMWGIATLVGPAIGGVFAEAGAWRWAFWSVIPPTALFALMALLVLPRRAQGAPETKQGLPLVQLGLLTGAVITVSAGSVMSQPEWNAASIAAALALTLALVRRERRTHTRLLPRGSLVPGTRLAALYAALSLLAIAVTSSEIFVPLFLQVLHAQSPLVAGYLAALMAGGWTIGSLASSGATPARAARILRAAPGLALAGMMVLAVLVPAGSEGSWATLAPLVAGLMLVGLGVGLAWPHLLTRVLQVAPVDEQDLASSSLTTIQLFATAIGAALAGMVVNLAGLNEPGGLAGTANAATWLFGLFAFAPLLACVVLRSFAERG